MVGIFSDRAQCRWFSDRARKVLQMANQEAHHFNHAEIGLEHLLIGLVKEGASAAAETLIDLGLDLRTARQEVADLVPPAENAFLPGKLPLSSATRQLLEEVQQAALASGSQEAGTEHLLLALVGVRNGVAANVLARHRITLWTVRKHLRARMERQ
jgi:ATP-dependent Clp protease ATP-binding subunit ClpC